MRWPPYPRTLFSRLMLLLLFGLLLSEMITALVLIQDRGEAIQRAVGIHSAQRIAGIVKILEQMPSAQRQEAVAALDTPGMRISLAIPPQTEVDGASSTTSTLFLGVLRYYLEGDRAIRLNLVGNEVQQYFDSRSESSIQRERGTGMRDMMQQMGRGTGMRDMMQQHMAEAGLILSTDEANLIQIELEDGQWVSFGEQLPEEMTAWPLRVVLALGLVLVTLVGVALVAVRWIIRPLGYLADSARALGKDLQRPPLLEEGPEEVRSTLKAFNTMQAQIRRFVDERSRFLAAISHDLKTPITRLRLRCGLLDDEALQTKFERDLSDMEDLVQGILDFMRDEAGNEKKQALDINDLLETIQIDGEEDNSIITLKGRAKSAYYCHPTSLRRLITNIVDNALKYGGQADIQVEDSEHALSISISDAGSGIPEAQIEKLFEPFTRLEESRNKATGGSGLGLSIAKNIALAHGGTLTLKNRQTGGLNALITLPR